MSLLVYKFMSWFVSQLVYELVHQFKVSWIVEVIDLAQCPHYQPRAVGGSRVRIIFLAPTLCFTQISLTAHRMPSMKSALSAEKLTALTLIALMCGKNAIPRVGGRHQAGHYTATKVAYLHGLYHQLIWISQRQHRCCIPKIGVIGVRNKLRQQTMYCWPGTDASTGFIGCALIMPACIAFNLS